MNIKYLHNEEIDRIRWDTCVTNSSSNLIYGHSVFLDTMIKKWDAIIVNDYEAVLPLPWKKKWGISYIYSPAFTQQLGLFSANNSIKTDDLLGTIKQHFKYADLYLNFTNETAENVIKKTNLVLNLNKPYEEIFLNYKDDLKKNLKKANKENLKYSDTLLIPEAINMYKLYYGKLIKGVLEKDYQHFNDLCCKLEGKKMVFTRQALDPQSNINAIALFLFDGCRIYNIMNTTTPEGKNKEANHFLLDRVIREFAGKNYILDFEGSDVTGIKNFYEKFNPANQPYFFYRYNNLNALVKLIKK